MNKDRRKALKAIADETKEIFERLDALRDEEQEYFDNMPEGIQDSERGEKAQEAISALDEACEALESIPDNIDTACE